MRMTGLKDPPLQRAGLKPGVYKISTKVLQLSRAAEGSHGEKHKQQSNSDREADQPASDVARPGAKRGIEPAEREDGKNRADNFVKKLLERAPQPPEAALLLRRSGCACGRGHKSILTQKEADDRKRG